MDQCPSPASRLPARASGLAPATSFARPHSAGNVSTCSFVVTIVDTTPPQVTCSPDISVDTTNTAGQVVTYIAAASDPCGIASFGCQPPSGSLFPPGTTTVTCRATDGSGNSNACSFGVTVRRVNQCPLADVRTEPLCVMPGLTTPLFVAGEDDEGCAVFDASISRDADGDPLTFMWFVDGLPAVISTNAILTNCFSIGPHFVQFTVDDGKCVSFGTIHFEVVTACDLVEILINDINNSTLPRNKKRPLIANLKNICKQFEKDKNNKFVNAIKKLEAFQKKLKGELKRYPVEQAQFDAEAQSIIDAVNCAVDLHAKKHKHDDDHDHH